MCDNEVRPRNVVPTSSLEASDLQNYLHLLLLQRLMREYLLGYDQAAPLRPQTTAFTPTLLLVHQPIDPLAPTSTALAVVVHGRARPPPKFVTDCGIDVPAERI